MKTLRIFFVCLLGVAWAVLFALPAFAQDQQPQGQGQGEVIQKTEEKSATPEVPKEKPKINNLPQNWKGLSGLFFTTSTRTLDPGTVEVGPAWIMENSYKPSFTRTTYAFNAGVGIPNHFEFGLHIPYVQTDLYTTRTIDIFGNPKYNFTKVNQAGIGSVEGLFKWAINQQSLFLPSFAVGLGFIAPSSNYTQGISSVKYFGFKALLCTSLEINDLFFTDYAFAVIADGALVFRDLGFENRKYEEKHGEIHMGLVFPLHPRNYLTLITEYEGILLMGTTNANNENSFLGGLRFTTQHINLTAGAQYVLVATKDMRDKYRYVANLTYKLGPPWPLFP